MRQTATRALVLQQMSNTRVIIKPGKLKSCDPWPAHDPDLLISTWPILNKKLLIHESIIWWIDFSAYVNRQCKSTHKCHLCPSLSRSFFPRSIIHMLSTRENWWSQLPMLAMAERRTERNARTHMRSSSSSNSHRCFAQKQNERAKKV